VLLCPFGLGGTHIILTYDVSGIIAHTYEIDNNIDDIVSSIYTIQNNIIGDNKNNHIPRRNNWKFLISFPLGFPGQPIMHIEVTIVATILYMNDNIIYRYIIYSHSKYSQPKRTEPFRFSNSSNVYSIILDSLWVRVLL
jgi:hypothetical protein